MERMAYDAGDYLIRPIMSAESGLPADAIVNDFAVSFIAGVPNAAEIEDAVDAVGNFYTVGAAAVNKVGNYISEWVDRGATHVITATQITAPPMGSPVFEKAWLGPPAPTVPDSLPYEVAGCLSFHADLTGIAEEAGATRPRARRRGRLYIGPLSLQAVDYDANPVTLSTNFRAALAARAVALADELEAAGWYWSVWSRVDATLRPVVGGWTDNAPDSQRRRGIDATNRATWGPVGP